MNRKKTSFFFLLLANIIILAHVFIPHHHHGDHLCLGITNCHTHTAACQHEDQGTGHHHDGKTSDDCCQLKNIQALPANLTRHDLISRNISIPSFDGLDFMVTVSVSALIDPVFEFRKSVVPDVPGIKTDFLANSRGLRAPPAV